MLVIIFAAIFTVSTMIVVCLFVRDNRRYDFYLAGPMRGYTDLNEKEFSRAAAALRRNGFTVFNPSEANDDKLSFEECMRVDLDAVVNRCHCVAILPGWRESIGCNGEVLSAFMTGKRVVEIDFVDSQSKVALVTEIATNEFCLPYRQNGQKLHPIPSVLKTEKKKQT